MLDILSQEAMALVIGAIIQIISAIIGVLIGWVYTRRKFKVDIRQYQLEMQKREAELTAIRLPYNNILIRLHEEVRQFHSILLHWRPEHRLEYLQEKTSMISSLSQQLFANKDSTRNLYNAVSAGLLTEQEFTNVSVMFDEMRLIESNFYWNKSLYIAEQIAARDNIATKDPVLFEATKHPSTIWKYMAVLPDWEKMLVDWARELCEQLAECMSRHALDKWCYKPNHRAQPLSH